MRLTEYIDYLNNGKKNVKRYTHYDPNADSRKSVIVKRPDKKVKKMANYLVKNDNDLLQHTHNGNESHQHTHNGNESHQHNHHHGHGI